MGIISSIADARVLQCNRQVATQRPLRLTSLIASGWSKKHREGLSPSEKLRLIAAHTHTSHSGRWLLLSSERFQYILLPNNHYQRNV